jgi:hypothetical protein
VSGNNGVWYQYFGRGDQYNDGKGDRKWVRLVRDLKEGSTCKGQIFSVDGKYFEAADNDESVMMWNDAMEKYDMIEEDNSIEAISTDRDTWRNKAKLYLHLLALVEDNIKDDHTSGLVRAALKGEE